MSEKKYRLWCETERKHYEVWDSVKPVYCPTSTSHYVPQDRIREINQGDVPLDRSNKLRVHQTSRKLTTVWYWSGTGDDPSNPTDVGGGEKMNFYNLIGTVSGTGMVQGEPHYIDLNCVENETFLHEGFLTWKYGLCDQLSVELVSRVTNVEFVGGTNYYYYYGIIVPAPAPGYGNCNIVSDITTHSGGLIYMPIGDNGVRPQAFWDADWNKTTKKYENITPAVDSNGRGIGQYNMFAYEKTFQRFFNKIPILGDGFIPFSSSDASGVGHGMRFKVTGWTNFDQGDHDWVAAAVMCMHREKTC